LILRDPAPINFVAFDHHSLLIEEVDNNVFSEIFEGHGRRTLNIIDLVSPVFKCRIMGQTLFQDDGFIDRAPREPMYMGQVLGSLSPIQDLRDTTEGTDFINPCNRSTIHLDPKLEVSIGIGTVRINREFRCHFDLSIDSHWI